MIFKNPFKKSEPPKKMSDQVLWDHLDHCAIDFRSSQSDLIKRYGTRPSGWAEGLQYCEFQSARPFIAGFAHPLVFQFSETTDLRPPPSYCVGFVRASGDVFENFQTAVHQLEGLFGSGVDVSSSNTRSRLWVFGSAQVRATVFPPRLNRAKNSRHDAIEGSATECSVAIEPAYCPELSNQERAQIESYSALFLNKTSGSGDHSLHVIGEMRRYAQVTAPIDPGFGLNKEALHLIQIIDAERLNILPKEWIESVQYTQIRPAKGGGGITLDVMYKPDGEAGSRPRWISLIRDDFGEDAHKDVAMRLVGMLGARFEERITDDV